MLKIQSIFVSKAKNLIDCQISFFFACLLYNCDRFCKIIYKLIIKIENNNFLIVYR